MQPEVSLRNTGKVSVARANGDALNPAPESSSPEIVVARAHRILFELADAAS